jgi:hypothetical protein
LNLGSSAFWVKFVTYGIPHCYWPDLLRFLFLHLLLLPQPLAQSPDHLYTEELHVRESRKVACDGFQLCV